MLSLRSNGFIAYVPAFDAKGPVYISDREGQVQVCMCLRRARVNHTYTCKGSSFTVLDGEG